MVETGVVVCVLLVASNMWMDSAASVASVAVQNSSDSVASFLDSILLLTDSTLVSIDSDCANIPTWLFLSLVIYQINSEHSLLRISNRLTS